MCYRVFYRCVLRVIYRYVLQGDLQVCATGVCYRVIYRYVCVVLVGTFLPPPDGDGMFRLHPHREQ